MTIVKILPAKKNKSLSLGTLRVEIYTFASAYYARLIDNLNFVFEDSAGKSTGTYKEALEFAKKFE